ncbi:hypothetical protein KEM55_007490, partial [Ascosphaera atra]
SVFGNKTEDGLPQNSTLIKVATVNGTQKIYINGSLANATGDSKESMSPMGRRLLAIQASGHVALFALVVSAVTLL